MKRIISQLVNLLLIAFVAFSVTSTSPIVATLATVVFWFYAVFLALGSLFLIVVYIGNKQAYLEARNKLSTTTLVIGYILGIVQLGVFLYAGWAWCVFWMIPIIVISTLSAFEDRSV